MDRSSVAYSWLVNTSKVFPVFIQNKIKEIRKLIDIACFKLIDTKRNSVDIVSREVKPAKLLSNRLWFSGPEFLTLDQYSWPSLKVGEKFILLSEIESRGNDVCMCDVICKEDEKNTDNEIKRKINILKQVEHKIEKNVPDINLCIINTEDIHADCIICKSVAKSSGLGIFSLRFRCI